MGACATLQAWGSHRRQHGTAQPQVLEKLIANATIRTIVGVGTLVGSLIVGAAVVRAGRSSPHTYPPVDPARVECTAFRPTDDQLCYKTANEWFVLGISVLIIALGSSGLLAGPREKATAKSKTCTESNVAGSYGLSGSGIIVSNPFGLPEGPVATVGVITFDEQGHWASHRSTNVNGQFVSSVSQAGLYTVYPDCTFTFVDATNNAVQFVGVFVADRDEAWFMATGEGVVVTYTLKRIESEN
jgi:hypothetical protein